METPRYKFPRTPHLPWSESSSSDDLYLPKPLFDNKEVVVSEKLDGENYTIYSDKYSHARSTTSAWHESREWVSALAGRIWYDIPDGWRICGENMYAKHSIHYECLESYFYVFAIFDENNICLSWTDTQEYCNQLGLTPVLCIYQGQWDDLLSLVQKEGGWNNWWKNSQHSCHESEGYVIRNAQSFPYNDWSSNAAKMVRKNHVQTDDHWRTQKLVKNELRNWGKES